MSLMIEWEISAELPFDAEQVATSVVDAALEREGFPYAAEVNLTLTDNDGIKECNRAYRDIDAATDVLSFPMLSYDTAGDFSHIDEDYSDNFNPDTGEVMLGDIVVSVDKVAEQAAAYGHSEKREFAFLVAHSMLHLMGYDHEAAEEAAVMEARQEEILDSLGISRDIGETS